MEVTDFSRLNGRTLTGSTGLTRRLTRINGTSKRQEPAYEEYDKDSGDHGEPSGRTDQVFRRSGE